MSLTADLKQQLPQHHQLYIGTGRVTAGRRGLFRAQEGLAVEMLDRVFQLPPCNGKNSAGCNNLVEGGGIQL